MSRSIISISSRRAQPPHPGLARPAAPVRKGPKSSILSEVRDLLADNPALAQQPNMALYLALWEKRDGIVFPVALRAQLLSASNPDTVERARRRVLAEP